MKIGDINYFKVGDLVRFSGGSWSLEGKTAIYLGKNFLTRDDGMVIQNHKVMVTGRSSPTIIDRNMLKHMKRVVK